MNRAGQILLEVLVAGIFLALVIPPIRPLCWKYFGPDLVAYYGMVAENNALIAQNEQKAASIAQKDREASLEEDRRRRAHDAAVAQAESEHRRAMVLYGAFTERQANLYASCVTEAKGKLGQSQKDRTINQIWMSYAWVRTCQELHKKGAYSP
jgi:hypothetical protein